MTAQPLAACTGVSVHYRIGDLVVHALDGVDLQIEHRDRVALLGRSGSGKTTLLHVLGGLVTPGAGTVEWHGAPGQGIAYVFQGANLLPTFTAFENVAFAALLSGGSPERSPETLLRLVGLDEEADHLPAELSGGEAQRVAIARALARQPELLLCDEPTGHLDSDTGERVLDLIDALQEELGFALVVATHDVDVAARLTRSVELTDGRVIDEEVPA